MAALLYFTGVAKMFPKNPKVAGYLMTAADETRRPRSTRCQARV